MNTVLRSVLVFVLVFTVSCSPERKAADSRIMFDTLCEIIVYSSSDEAGAIIERAFERMYEIEAKFDAWDRSSLLYSFNSSGRPLNDREISHIASLSVSIASESGGAFDPTMMHLSLLWDFSSESPAVPSGQELAAALEKTGYEKIKVEKDTVYALSGEVMLDFGAVAKGYAVDEASKLIRESGVDIFMVNLGGDLYASGDRRWKIGLRDPNERSLAAVIDLTDSAVVTSGTYERYFEQDGKRYHHILDPATGMPVRGMSSVTILAPSAALADAWATAVFVMGAEKGMRKIDNMEGFEAIIILENGERLISSGAGRMVRWLK